MAETIYILCAVTSVVCTVLLFRGYAATRVALLFWTALFFIAQTCTNILLFVDLVMVPHIDLSMLRNAVILSGLIALIYGLVEDAA